MFKRPKYIVTLDTDDINQIKAFRVKLEAALKKGENIYIPNTGVAIYDIKTGKCLNNEFKLRRRRKLSIWKKIKKDCLKLRQSLSRQLHRHLRLP